MSFLAWKKSQRSSTSFWLGERALPRSLVSHVVLKVSAEGLGYFTTSSGYISGPMGHWHPETLEPRVEAPGHRNLGTLEPRVSVYLSRSTPRLISTFSKSEMFVSNFVHTAARGTLLSRRGAAAKQTPLTRRGAAARQTPLSRRGTAARSTPLCQSVVAILTWTDRRHHVPALTVTSGERGVGSDMHAWGRLSIAHSRRHFNPRASSFSCFSYHFFLLRLATPALRLGVISGSWLWLIVFSMTLRTQARPAIEFVLWQGGPASILIWSSGSS